MSIIANLINAFSADTNIEVTSVSTGKKILMSFLTELEHRTILLGECKNSKQFDLMTIGLRKQFQLAVKDWNAFCEQYECTIQFNKAIDSSNVFGLKLKEKNDCPRDWAFRFNNLKRVSA